MVDFGRHKPPQETAAHCQSATRRHLNVYSVQPAAQISHLCAFSHRSDSSERKIVLFWSVKIGRLLVSDHPQITACPCQLCSESPLWSSRHRFTVLLLLPPCSASLLINTLVFVLLSQQDSEFFPITLFPPPFTLLLRHCITSCAWNSQLWNLLALHAQSRRRALLSRLLSSLESQNHIDISSIGNCCQGAHLFSSQVA